MEMIKRLMAACLLAVPVLLQAQEFTYSLPSTVFKIEVEAEQEYFFAGPYAAYAQKMLGIEAPRQNSVKAHVTRVRLLPCIEADPVARYTAESGLEGLLALSAQGLVCFRDTLETKGITWRYSPVPARDFSDKGLTGSDIVRLETTMELMQIDTGFVRMPVTREVPGTKTLEEKAADAAEIVLSVRRERMNIAMGQTDATFSGDALRAALEELTRIEEEYLSLFRGYSVTRPLRGVFDVRPSADERMQRHVAFVLSDTDGLRAEGRGVPFILEIEAETSPEPSEPADRRRRSLRYREPAICVVRLSEDGRPLLETRAPVYQLGREGYYSVSVR
jgi:hypothetical protein